MSRRRLKARNKITQKMSRDGLILKNETTGENQLISKRGAELDLKGGVVDKTTYSQVGNRSDRKSKRHIRQKLNKNNKQNNFNQSEVKSVPKHNVGKSVEITPVSTVLQKESILSHDTKTMLNIENSKVSIKEITSKTLPQKLTFTHEATKSPTIPVIQPSIDSPKTFSQLGKRSYIKSTSRRIEVISTETKPVVTDTSKTADTTKFEVDSKGITHPKPDIKNKEKISLEPKDSSVKHEKPSKLNFSKEEPKADKPITRKVVKAQHQADKAQNSLEKAKSKLPSKKKLHVKYVFDETKGKAKPKLIFEKQVKTQKEHLKGPLPLRPIKAGANLAIANAHRKLFQVEHENVGTKAAHRGAMIVEGGVRSALKFHKTAPYRKVEKLQKQVAKKTIKLNYEKLLADNPKLSSNVISRMLQKRKIKKEYAKVKREAERAASVAKKAGSITSRATKALVGVIRKHPFVSGTIAIIALLLFVFMSLFGLGAGAGSGGLSGILTASYLSEDVDIDLVELNYSQWKTDLMMQIADMENSNPGYDEYRYNTGDISHNPYELMAYLTAVYQYFSYDVIQADLKALFDEQYSLTLTETTETCYNDPDDTNEDGDYEPYEWKILTVTLNARSFKDVIQPKMTTEQRQHYEILMQTKGSRQYAGNPFATGWLPYVTSYYGYRVHPISGEKDLHRGIDIAFPKGTEIHSTQDGTVTFAGVNGGYGNVVVIENDKGLVTKYAHCDSILVSVGQVVKIGDVIATVGNTGNSTGAHLHIEVLKNGQYLNPLLYVDSGSFNLSPIYGSPGAAMGDGSYAALIAEAESHLGKPYIFGANGPNSFDCSSFICFIFSNSGVKNMPRTTAQGIYNQCTPIPESERQPGDLVFFQGTYSTTNTVTHIGLYVGNGYMIHAGSPVQYTKIDGNPYWQAHMFSYGRIN